MNAFYIYTRIKDFLSDQEEGQTAVEYCIMIACFALALAAAGPGLVNAVTAFFAAVSSKIVGLVGT